MPKLTLEVTPDQHRTIKAMAALAGKSVKEFVVERTLGGQAAYQGADTEYQRFLEFVEERAEEGRRGEIIETTAEQLMADLKHRG